MALSNEQKSAIISDFQLSGTDTGSPEVQIALLSARINDRAKIGRTTLLVADRKALAAAFEAFAK